MRLISWHISRLTRMYCGSIVCPAEVLSPSEDCTLNVSLPFSLQVRHQLPTVDSAFYSLPFLLLRYAQSRIATS